MPDELELKDHFIGALFAAAIGAILWWKTDIIWAVVVSFFAYALIGVYLRYWVVRLRFRKREGLRSV